jgi:hypothetical protein
VTADNVSVFAVYDCSSRLSLTWCTTICVQYTMQRIRLKSFADVFEIAREKMKLNCSSVVLVSYVEVFASVLFRHATFK